MKIKDIFKKPAEAVAEQKAEADEQQDVQFESWNSAFRRKRTIRIVAHHILHSG